MLFNVIFKAELSSHRKNQVEPMPVDLQEMDVIADPGGEVGG